MLPSEHLKQETVNPSEGVAALGEFVRLEDDVALAELRAAQNAIRKAAGMTQERFKYSTAMIEVMRAAFVQPYDVRLALADKWAALAHGGEWTTISVEIPPLRAGLARVG